MKSLKKPQTFELKRKNKTMYKAFCIKHKHKFLAILLIINVFLLFLANNTKALGQTMTNSDYILRMENLNTAAGKPTGSGYKLNLTVGQTGPGLYSGSNYKVRAGFQYISSIIPFRFIISSTEINFGDLTPTNPITRNNTLTVTNQSAGGYTVKVYENHQLLVPSTGALIPDTTCDHGTCTESTADTWTSSLTYGFGYRCDAVTTNYCDSSFTTSTNYRQFADKSKSETEQTVMSGATGRTQQSTITYKANISTAQSAGLYSNVLTYIATPTY